jgi:hypothetical protein
VAQRLVNQMNLVDVSNGAPLVSRGPQAVLTAAGVATGTAPAGTSFPSVNLTPPGAKQYNGVWNGGKRPVRLSITHNFRAVPVRPVV